MNSEIFSSTSSRVKPSSLYPGMLSWSPSAPYQKPKMSHSRPNVSAHATNSKVSVASLMTTRTSPLVLFSRLISRCMAISCLCGLCARGANGKPPHNQSRLAGGYCAMRRAVVTKHHSQPSRRVYRHLLTAGLQSPTDRGDTSFVYISTFVLTTGRVR